MKNKKERDWKFIIGMIVLLAIFAVMGGAFWNMVGKQAQIVREEEQKEEANAISAIYIETGEFLKTGVCGSEQWNYFQRRHTGRGHLQ